MSCSLKVSVAYPCGLSEGHEGVCQPDPEGQLRIYGITVEDLRDIQRCLAQALQLGLVRGDGGHTIFYRYTTLLAALERALPRAGPGALVRASSIRAAIHLAQNTEPHTIDRGGQAL